ncbi:MAG TPA: IS481 family transposase [Thermoanaerobaculia bacterium]|nr:IS481 family transposase [Thermoanaerobaculia bacterium]
MALLALDKRYSVTEVAMRYGVSRPTVRLWRDRYREGGRAGLQDLSHATHRCPHRMSEQLEQLILAERKRFGWGSKKILRRLADAHPDLDLPGRSAIDAVLRRNGLIAERQRRQRARWLSFRHRYTATEPAELMTIDHKGQFKMGNGAYCFPLTMVDSVSRYVLACEALSSTRLSEAWPVITRVFREYGLPTALQSDNGPPFGSPNGGLSTMSVRLMMLGVLPVFGRPAHPQDNGRHERMHRDLKAETTRPPSSTRSVQQKRFDEFVHRYNVERPHEGISMQRPANLFTCSARPYPRRQRGPEYEAHFETRKVTDTGEIKLHGHPIFIAQSLAGQTVGLEPIDEHLYAVHFYRFRIGKVDTDQNTFI